ncbi:DUF2147 domain-containing protein [Sungkyunkwania multivorans]|uniref:DUF2147 domain-containing protein n=1 Tax=Sungkyunkwania multivorans TaxID=1173618 RepID=A0ABW3D044_9FLAO
MKKKIIVATFFMFGLASISAQSVVGKWKTIDDETGEARSIVEIYKEGGKIFGKIVKLIDPEKENPTCFKCDDDDPRKDKPVLGMVIIDGLKDKGDEYSGGKILDPEKGKEYKCKIWVDEDDSDKLNVRGYIAFLYRTQNWYRVK